MNDTIARPDGTVQKRTEPKWANILKETSDIISRGQFPNISK